MPELNLKQLVPLPPLRKREEKKTYPPIPAKPLYIVSALCGAIVGYKVQDAWAAQLMQAWGGISDAGELCLMAAGPVLGAAAGAGMAIVLRRLFPRSFAVSLVTLGVLLFSARCYPLSLYFPAQEGRKMATALLLPFQHKEAVQVLHRHIVHRDLLAWLLRNGHFDDGAWQGAAVSAVDYRYPDRLDILLKEDRARPDSCLNPNQLLHVMNCTDLADARSTETLRVLLRNGALPMYLRPKPIIRGETEEAYWERVLKELEQEAPEAARLLREAGINI